MFRVFGLFVLENLRLVWARLTLSKVTIAYVAFTVLHCCVQVGLQSEAFVINNHADGLLKAIEAAAGLPVPHGINILVKDGPLYLCDDTPDLADCTMIWAPKTAASNAVPGTSTAGYSTSSYDAGYYYASPTGTAAFGAAIVLTPPSSPTLTTSAVSTSAARSSSDPGNTPSTSASPSIITPSPSASLSPAVPPVSKDVEAVVTEVITVTVTPSAPSVAPTAPARPNDAAVHHSGGSDPEDLDVFLPFIPLFRRVPEAIEDASLPTADSEEDLINYDWRARRGLARSIIRRKLQVGKGVFDSNGTLEFVPVSGFSPASLPAAVAPPSSQSSSSDPASGVADLPPACVKVLAWPLQNLATSGREDIVFLAFNIWALGMSFVAVLNESMPHMIAALITHILLTSWTAFQLVATEGFRTEFLRITKDGACQGVNLLPNYWVDRRNIELAELVLNVLALVTSAFLSWCLLKQFGWQTFKRVGASLSVNHMYKLVLGLSVVLQLSMFFIVSSIALWVEQISNGPAEFITEHTTAYQIFYLVIIILLVPWAACGWFGVRRESKELTLFFLIGTVSVITSWGGMFFSHTFRLLFVTWGFFAMVAVIAMVLSGVTLVLGIACRLGFGKNAKTLSSYLNPDEESAVEKREYTEEFGFGYGEKVGFPGSDVPTYEAIMKRGMTPTTTASSSPSKPASVSLPPLTVPSMAHTNSTARTSSHSPFSSTSSSPLMRILMITTVTLGTLQVFCLIRDLDPQRRARGASVSRPLVRPRRHG